MVEIKKVNGRSKNENRKCHKNIYTNKREINSDQRLNNLASITENFIAFYHIGNENDADVSTDELAS